MKAIFGPFVLFGFMIAAQASAENPKPTIEVSGLGVVVVPSDHVVLVLSVRTIGEDLTDLVEAKTRNDRVAAQIYKLAQSQHLRLPSLMNTTLDNGGATKGSSSFLFSSSEKKQQTPIHMSRSVEVRCDDLNQAVRFISDIAKWESAQSTHELRITQVRFGVANPESHLLEVQRRAVKSATEKAQVLAEANGLRLGDAMRVFDGNTLVEGSSSQSVYESSEVDPFSGEPVGGHSTESGALSTSLIRFVANQDHGPANVDLDHLPPRQVTFSASVRIVFEVHKR